MNDKNNTDDIITKPETNRFKSMFINGFSDIDMFNIKSILTIASILFLVITMSTAAFAGYKWAEHAAVWAQWLLVAIMLIVGFFESYSLFYSISALYYKRYSIFLISILCYLPIMTIGLFTTSITLDNMINDGYKTAELELRKSSIVEDNINKVKLKIDELEQRQQNKIDTLYTQINSKLVIAKTEMISSESGNSFTMADSNGKQSPIWMRFCLPGNVNQFTSDINCSNLQLELTNKTNQINEEFDNTKEAYETQLTMLQKQKLKIDSFKGTSFDNSTTKAVKSVTASEDESGSDLLVKLLSVSVVAIMVTITSMLIFKDGKAYQFYRPSGTINVIDMFIQAFINKWKNYSEDSNQKLLEKQHKTALMKQELAMVEASLRAVTTTSSDVLNDQNVKDDPDTIFNVKDEDTILDNILSDSKTINQHRKDRDSFEDEDSGSRLGSLFKNK